MADRYLLELAYRGTAYAGWQRQPNAISVEETIDSALSLILGQPIKLVGCGRTDAGVHASAYAAHFNFTGDLPPALLPRLNRFLPEDIALQSLYRIPETVHARFTASGRAYVYRISPRKDPFRPDTVTVLPRPERIDRSLLQPAAEVLLDYEEFAPFCKTNSDAFTMRCDLREVRWVLTDAEWQFHIAADRFLRGMVRLIVGMCIRVGRDKLTLDQVRRAMDTQQPLPAPWSAPAAGLYLSAVEYPDRKAWVRIE